MLEFAINGSSSRVDCVNWDLPGTKPSEPSWAAEATPAVIDVDADAAAEDIDVVDAKLEAFLKDSNSTSYSGLSRVPIMVK